MVRAVIRGQDGIARLARPLPALLLPVLAFPLLSACADRVEQRDPCERPASCADRRPLPILY